MRKYKQVKKSKDIFDMKELAEVEHPPPLRKANQSGNQINIVDFKLRKCYNDGDIFAVGNGGIMKQKVCAVANRKAAVR